LLSAVIVAITADNNAGNIVKLEMTALLPSVGKLLAASKYLLALI
jgi:hypothetical protein